MGGARSLVPASGHKSLPTANDRVGRATGVSSGVNVALASVGKQQAVPGAVVAVQGCSACNASS
jgi:hypothetical protein